MPELSNNEVLILKRYVHKERDAIPLSFSEWNEAHKSLERIGYLKVNKKLEPDAQVFHATNAGREALAELESEV